MTTRPTNGTTQYVDVHRILLSASADYPFPKIQITQKSIKHVLRERWYAWEEATRLYQKGHRPQYEDSMEEEAATSSKP